MPAAQQFGDPDPIDTHELMGLLWQRRLLVLGSAVLWTAVFAAIAYLTTPVYRGSTELLAAKPQDRSILGDLGSGLSSVTGLASLAGIDLPSQNEDLDEAIAVLRSRQFTQEFIAANNLMQDLYPTWDGQTGTWKTKSWRPRRPPTLARAFRRFDTSIRTVKRDTKTGIIELTIDWKDRLKAAEWANGLVRALNAEMRARAITKADASIRYLQKELAGTGDVGTRDAVNRLMESEIKQRMYADVTEEYSLRVVDRALPSDADDPLRPRKALLVAIGFITGLVVGVVVLVLRHLFRASARTKA
jgi:uncharacterized protein involved in exopolysaccharide biosynthesis